MENINMAHGAPGKKSSWTSAAKTGIGKAMNASSHIVFTLSDGVINEIYYPREDTACVKDICLVVSDGTDFLSNEKEDTTSKTRMIKDGVPAYEIINTCKQGRYVLEKEVITDPFRDAILQKTTFRTTGPAERPLQLYALVTPRIANHSDGHTAWLGSYNGTPMLFAEYERTTIALVASVPFAKRSVGYLETSDGWEDLSRHKTLQWAYDRAEDGNVMLAAEIDLSKEDTFTLVLGFGHSAAEAGNRALASLLAGFDHAKEHFVAEWEHWQQPLWSGKQEDTQLGKYLKTSAAVLHMAEAKSFPGAILASLSIPWGSSKADDALGGYHLVWPRDLVLTTGGFVALNDHESVLRIVNYLMSTQLEDGSWYQNMWVDGEPYWKGVQLDQVAMPVMLASWCYFQKVLNEEQITRYWPGVKKALSFVILHGPSTEQERWEEQEGINTFSLATQISALLAGARLAEHFGEKDIARYCYETADYLNSRIEEWTYVTDTALSRQYEVEGYYIRINPKNAPVDTVKDEDLKIVDPENKNRKLKVSECISVDALALVRFGLRAADDPRILNTLKLIDDKLKVETPHGTCWHRYNGDIYGEDKDGNPHDDGPDGIGRAWPLLTGERGHYEIAAGNMDRAKELLESMENFTRNGFLSEQIWDQEDIPEKELQFGKPTGAAMPLSWAHAEYVKLCASIYHNRIYDLPEMNYDRYIATKTVSPFRIWRHNRQCEAVAPGKTLRIETVEAATIHWSADNWATTQTIETGGKLLGMHIADIPVQQNATGKISFTFLWKKTAEKDEKSFDVDVKA